MKPTDLAQELLSIVETTAQSLRTIDAAEAAHRAAANSWSKKEIVGHLLDSATNNHQRFVRAQQGGELRFPDYEQEHWVRLQGYSESAWPEMVELWRLYNRHLAHIISRIPETQLAAMCIVGADAPVSLGYLLEDYLVHMRLHVQELV